MARFGSDKPDTRYGMELADLTERSAGAGSARSPTAVDDGGVVKGFAAPGGAALSRRSWTALVNEATSRGAKGLVWMAHPAARRSPRPWLKFLSARRTGRRRGR